jgi:hypothetical protein
MSIELGTRPIVEWSRLRKLECKTKVAVVVPSFITVFTPTDSHGVDATMFFPFLFHFLLHRGVESTPKNWNESRCALSIVRTVAMPKTGLFLLSCCLLQYCDKMGKVEEAAARLIEIKNVTVSAAALRDTGIFEESDLTIKNITKVKREKKKQEHGQKTASRPSLDGLRSPGEAKLWAATRLLNTDTKAQFAPNNYKAALDTIGIDVSVDDIKCTRNKLKRQATRDDEGGTRPPKRPCNSTMDSSFDDRPISPAHLLALLADASTPGFPAASEENNYDTSMDSSLEDRPTAMMSHSAAASISKFLGRQNTIWASMRSRCVK